MHERRALCSSLHLLPSSFFPFNLQHLHVAASLSSTTVIVLPDPLTQRQRPLLWTRSAGWPAHWTVLCQGSVEYWLLMTLMISSFCRFLKEDWGLERLWLAQGLTMGSRVRNLKCLVLRCIRAWVWPSPSTMHFRFLSYYASVLKIIF